MLSVVATLVLNFFQFKEPKRNSIYRRWSPWRDGDEEGHNQTTNKSFWPCCSIVYTSFCLRVVGAPRIWVSSWPLYVLRSVRWHIGMLNSMTVQVLSFRWNLDESSVYHYSVWHLLVNTNYHLSQDNIWTPTMTSQPSAHVSGYPFSVQAPFRFLPAAGCGWLNQGTSNLQEPAHVAIPA